MKPRQFRCHELIVSSSTKPPPTRPIRRGYCTHQVSQKGCLFGKSGKILGRWDGKENIHKNKIEGRCCRHEKLERLCSFNHCFRPFKPIKTWTLFSVHTHTW
ncbi:MAG: hypothetical protein ILA04_05310 [Prevotella sp.]|nr:hypothetical protein [Prevotella sp.]